VNYLSKVGRTILIRSHPEHLPTHTMQCFKIPKHGSHHLDKINRDFSWKNNLEKGLPLTARDKLCTT